MIEKCYVYFIWHGRIILRFGSIDVSSNSTYGQFYVQMAHRRLPVFTVSTKPKTVYSNSVWLSERNDSLAALLLTDHYISKISDLKRQIIQNEEKITLLRENSFEVVDRL